MTEVYHVHMYHVMRAKFCGIEADSPEKAIEIAAGNDLSFADEHEDAEEVTSYLVDVVGDEEYDNSRWYEADGTSPMCDFYYIRCEHVYDVTMNYDLLVRAADEADALVLWREYYGEMLDDGVNDEPKVRRVYPPVGRGAVPWN